MTITINNISTENDLFLAKSTFPSDFLDAALGEPYIIRDALNEAFPLHNYGKMDIHDFEYQKPNGYTDLVNLLESIHQAPVIITCGAKQAISALFYAIKKLNKNKIGLRTPYWGLFKPLINMHGLQQVEHIDECDAYLMVEPNNPDGYMYDKHTIKHYTNICKQQSKPLLHDGAYYSHVYLPRSFDLKPVGDVQIFTFSKLYGLSGLRLGYAVFYDTTLYKSVLEWQEYTTVGVSSLSQKFGYDLLSDMNDSIKHLKKFEDYSYNALQENKVIASQISSSILDTTNIVDNHGMFLWTKCHDFDAFKRAKINIISGEPFGMAGYVRMNLALHKNKMIEVVERLNNLGKIK